MEKLKEIVDIEELFPVIINNAFESIIYFLPVKNSDNLIIDFEFAFLNDAAFKLLSGKKEDYVAKKFLELFPYAADDGLFEAYKKVAETGEPSEGIYYYEYGEYKGWYKNSIIKYKDGIIVYFRDVTKNKMLEIEINKKNENLEKLIEERETLLKETHHRVKNNLQLVASMLNLQSQKIEDPHFREIINTNRQRILNIAKIHQRLYEDKVYSSFKLDMFISENVNALLKIYSDDSADIKINYDIDDINLNLNYTINIGIIVNELLTNSFKYAFQKYSHAEINISIKKQPGAVEIIISDNGRGMPADFNIEKSEALGLTLIKALTGQMEGTLNITGPPGTVVRIIFPYKE